MAKLFLDNGHKVPKASVVVYYQIVAWRKFISVASRTTSHVYVNHPKRPNIKPDAFKDVFWNWITIEGVDQSLNPFFERLNFSIRV
jgi:hypothetical protein